MWRVSFVFGVEDMGTVEVITITNKTYEITVSPSTTIAEFKAAIQDVTGLVPEQQILVHPPPRRFLKGIKEGISGAVNMGVKAAQELKEGTVSEGTVESNKLTEGGPVIVVGTH